MYETGALIIGGLVVSIVIILTTIELIFRIRYWIVDQNKPRKHFSSKFYKRLEYMSTDDLQSFFFSYLIGSFTIVATWPVTTPIILIVILLYILRWQIRRRREKRKK
jgi:hypothetical protein